MALELMASWEAACWIFRFRAAEKNSWHFSLGVEKRENIDMKKRPSSREQVLATVARAQVLAAAAGEASRGATVGGVQHRRVGRIAGGRFFRW